MCFIGGLDTAVRYDAQGRNGYGGGCKALSKRSLSPRAVDRQRILFNG